MNKNSLGRNFSQCQDVDNLLISKNSTEKNNKNFEHLAKLKYDWNKNNVANPSNNQNTEISVKLKLFYQSFVVVLGFCVNLLFGLKFDLNLFKKILKKPIGPLVAALCQFIVMPLIGILTAYLLNAEGVIAFVIILISCCPGGELSNIHSALLDGNVTMSTMMTITGIVTAIGAIPAWFYALGKNVQHESIQLKDTLPFAHLFAMLSILLIPIIIGIFIKSKYNNSLKILAYFKILIGIGVTLQSIFTIAIHYQFITYITRDMWYKSIILPWGGFILTVILAKLMRFPNCHIISIAIGVGIPDTLLTILVISATFKGKDLNTGLALALCHEIVTLPLIIIEITFNLSKYIYKKYLNYQLITLLSY
ncbi:hypothetical protein A3Q56_04454 [Intoshia linei]|uniref:Uncharacterized protein n=1 Tax=Intoshia linei TaxID=1819745 RepID=A0A177B0M0_9BILA|nr:hypothetical protein A3Q56_04454 [Intoshia linei]